MYSGHDRFVKFNRRGGANKQRGGGKIILKLIDGGARLLETPEYVLTAVVECISLCCCFPINAVVVAHAT